LTLGTSDPVAGCPQLADGSSAPANAAKGDTNPTTPARIAESDGQALARAIAAPEQGPQNIANWALLFADERFRQFGAQAYRDDSFMREHCRLGTAHFVHNSVDEANLQLLSKALEFGQPAILGAPFTPCHWGALAVLFHLFRANQDLRAKRTVYWLTTEPRERAMFSKVRIQGRFRRVCEAVSVFSSPTEFGEACAATSLVLLKELSEIELVRPGAILVVSDGRGELVFRKNEAADLLAKLVGTGCAAVSLVIPSRNLTYGLAPSAVCWPWSEAALAKAHFKSRLEGDAIPWKWEAGARNSGRAERRVRSIDGLKPIEDILVELKTLAYRLFSKPKSFYDVRCRTEFQRIVGVFRQLAIPFDDFDKGNDERRPSARLSRLESDADGASKDIADEIKIGLLYASDLIRKLQFSEAKWDLLRACVDECIAENRVLGIALPQPDPYTAEKTVEFVRLYSNVRGANLDVRIVGSPDELPAFEGEVVILGVPKLSQASRWRTPFRGRLTVLAWQFDRILGNLALHESNASAESMRRRTWTKYFRTPLETHAVRHSKISEVEDDSRSGDVADVDGEIEAFDLSYRGEHAQSQAIVSNAIKAKAEYLLTLDDHSVIPAMAGEEHHVLLSSYSGKAVKTKPTTKLLVGDRLILINGESYAQLSKRLMEQVDRASSLMSFNELNDRWQFLCVEQDDDDITRENFLKKVIELGCCRGRGTIISWLKLKRLGPDALEDIVTAALAAGDFDLASNAKQFWEGLEQQRERHRRLGYWLKKALAKSAGADFADSEKIVDPTLGLTFGDLQRGIAVKAIIHITRPQASKEDA
jgi:hypothetical protein